MANADPVASRCGHNCYKVRLGINAETNRWDGDNYFCRDAKKTIDFMGKIKKPWMAYKVLAAGAIHPGEALDYWFKNGADFILVGMFDFQITEDAIIARQAIARIKTDKGRGWRKTRTGNVVKCPPAAMRRGCWRQSSIESSTVRNLTQNRAEILHLNCAPRQCHLMTLNGAGGIRTPGAFRHNGFQDRRLQPLGHCSGFSENRNSAKTRSNALPFSLHRTGRYCKKIRYKLSATLAGKLVSPAALAIPRTFRA